MAILINLSNFPQIVENQVKAELPSRCLRATNALMHAKNNVLRGARSGKYYGRHRASAPGEPPAVQTGHLRGSSFSPITDSSHQPGIRSNAEYAEPLEYGTIHMAARPFRDRIIEMAMPQIIEIYQEPWHISF